MTWSLAATLLLLSGDVELNPGPKKGAPKETGPTPEQKIAELETTIKTYEEKVTGEKITQMKNMVMIVVNIKIIGMKIIEMTM